MSGFAIGQAACGTKIQKNIRFMQFAGFTFSMFGILAPRDTPFSGIPQHRKKTARTAAYGPGTSGVSTVYDNAPALRSGHRNNPTGHLRPEPALRTGRTTNIGQETNSRQHPRQAAGRGYSSCGFSSLKERTKSRPPRIHPAASTPPRKMNPTRINGLEGLTGLSGTDAGCTTT